MKQQCMMICSCCSYQRHIGLERGFKLSRVTFGQKGQHEIQKGRAAIFSNLQEIDSLITPSQGCEWSEPVIESLKADVSCEALLRWVEYPLERFLISQGACIYT